MTSVEAQHPARPQHTNEPRRVLACVSGQPETCNNALDDDCNGLIDEGCGLRSASVQFSAAWREPAVDVDLNVTDPRGQLVEVGRVGDSGLVKERDCPGRGNECQGINLENVVLDEAGALTRGLYRVRVRLEKLAGAEPPIRVSVGARLGPKTYGAEVELTREDEEQELRWRL